MNQQAVLAQGIMVSYIEKNCGQNKTFFLIHGNSSSSKFWSEQYDSLIFSEYRVIVFDLPAHGQSGNSSTPEIDYSVLGLGKIMAAAVEKLHKNNPYVLVGFSLGANVVAEMLAYQLIPIGIALISSCVLGGAITLDKIRKEGADLSPGFVDNPDEGALLTYINSW